jgi:hypothetical protein
MGEGEETAMKLEGGCYCKGVRYVAEGEPRLRAQCLCRECQYITGGGANFFMMMPTAGFQYVKGAPKTFTRTDIPRPVSREFCPDCGTHMATRIPGLDALVLKVGSLDDPAAFGPAPQMAIYAVDRQPFHSVAEGVPTFERGVPR